MLSICPGPTAFPNGLLDSSFHDSICFELLGLVPLQGFQAEFAWQGTSDVSAWMAARTSLQIQQRLGLQQVRDHNHHMLLRAVDVVQLAWGPGLATLGTQ